MNDLLFKQEFDRFAEKLHRQAKRSALSSDYYKQLTRKRYRDPNGYYPFRSAMLDIADLLQMADSVNIPWLDVRDANRMLLTIGHNFWADKAPSYWLEKSLFEAFLASDLPENITDLKRSIPIGCLFLPEGIVTPDGEALRWLVFYHRLAGEVLPSFRAGVTILKDQPQHFDYIAWASILPSSTVYAHYLRTDEPENTDPMHFSPRIKQWADTEREEQFVNQVSSVLAQSLLAVQVLPDLLERGGSVGFDTVPNRKRNPRKGELNWLSPNWIGRSYKVKRHSIGSGTHSSPSVHWRRGHWRRSPVGKREENRREWRWIQPVLVGVKSDG
jgi:hypothetical protein